MSELDATKPSDVDWGYLTELFRETEKPIRKDENVFYEFSSAMFANFKHILAEREQMRAKLEAAQNSLGEIAMLANHQIPAYAFGDNEAACDLASRMSSIYNLAAYDKEQP